MNDLYIGTIQGANKYSVSLIIHAHVFIVSVALICGIKRLLSVADGSCQSSLHMYNLRT